MQFFFVIVIVSSFSLSTFGSVIDSACGPDRDSFINQLEAQINQIDVIKKNCSGPKSEISDNLSVQLEKLQTNYNTINKRLSDGEGYIALLDEVIKQSPFSNLLACRDKLKTSSDISYKLMFQDPKKEEPFSVTYIYKDETKKGSKLDLEMNFKLKTSVQMALFTYLHELTHVCQAEKSKELRFKLLQAIENYNSNGRASDYSEYVKVKNEYYQYGSFIEVEAFYNMQLAYRFFTGKSSRLCLEESNQDPDDQAPFYEAYLEGERNLLDGNFAQAIIYGYHLDSQSKEEEKASLFDSSNQHSYIWNDRSEGKATMPSLHPSLKKMVEDLGIQVVEP